MKNCKICRKGESRLLNLVSSNPRQTNHVLYPTKSHEVPAPLPPMTELGLSQRIGCDWMLDLGEFTLSKTVLSSITPCRSTGFGSSGFWCLTTKNILFRHGRSAALNLYFHTRNRYATCRSVDHGWGYSGATRCVATCKHKRIFGALGGKVTRARSEDIKLRSRHLVCSWLGLGKKIKAVWGSLDQDWLKEVRIWFSKCGTKVILALAVVFDDGLFSNRIEDSGYFAGRCTVFKTTAPSSSDPGLNKVCVNQNVDKSRRR